MATASFPPGATEFSVSGMTMEFLVDTQGLETQRITIKSSETDSGNSPTTTIRAGTILYQYTDKKYYVFTTTGQEHHVAIITEDVDMLAGGTSAVDRNNITAITGGNLKKSKLIENGGVRGTLSAFDLTKVANSNLRIDERY